ncbi:MAG: methylmalonyl Co-A mutase-associated GTPase MeaB [Candidatus Acidiferrales bacterium]
MKSAIDNWAEQVRAGDIRAISRAVTAIENRAPEAEDLLRDLFPHTGKAYRVGVTGAPGTGKSTLVDRLAKHYRAAHKTVGIIAVDPSSPFTGGAILGDRIRMQGHATDAGIFIRSMATRGSLGGLAEAASDTAVLLDAAGKELVLVETVGVGQGEIEIVRLADCTLVVLVPGMGDDVQNLKAGLMEIADIFVLNKCDREGADRFEEQLRAMLSISPERNGWRTPIVRTIASESKGIAELAGEIERFRAHSAASADRGVQKIAYWKQRLLEMLEHRLVARVIRGSEGDALLTKLATQIAARKKDPYSAVSEMLESAGLGDSK